MTTLAMICGECSRTVPALHSPSFCPECRSISGRFASIGHELDLGSGSVRVRMVIRFHGEWSEDQRADLEAQLQKK